SLPWPHLPHSLQGTRPAEHVADPNRDAYPPWRTRPQSELAPDAGDVHPEPLRAGLIDVPPRALDQPRVRHHPPLVERQLVQDPKLQPRQPDDPLGHGIGHGVGRWVKNEIAGPKLARALPIAGSPAWSRPEARDQVVGADRL